MVGGALEGDIQRDVDVILTRLGEEAPKVLQRAELWMNRLVSPLRRANRPRAPWIIGAGIGGVVSPLAMGDADGMDGG